MQAVNRIRYDKVFIGSRQPFFRNRNDANIHRAIIITKHRRLNLNFFTIIIKGWMQMDLQQLLCDRQKAGSFPVYGGRSNKYFG